MRTSGRLEVRPRAADDPGVDVLLDRDQPVDVVLDGGWRLTARVASVGLDYVDLGPVDGAMALPGDLQWCHALMSWRTRLGAAHRHGVLVGGPQGMLRLHPIGAALKVQRRRFVRVPVDLSAAVIAADRRLMTRTLDLSVGGMLISPADTLAINDEVRFALDLGDVTISGSGVVVRGDSAGLRGVRFDDLHGRAERALSRYVAQRQRELIAG
jgi:PilZ domain-containing protein